PRCAPRPRALGRRVGLRDLSSGAARRHLRRGARLAKESPPPDSKWLVHVASLPMDDPAARMRVLRTLESMGCAVLREGVYLLPDSQANRLGLRRLSEHMSRMSGSAHILQATSLDPQQGQAFRSLFDRAGKYQELIKAVEGLRAGFGISEPS